MSTKKPPLGIIPQWLWKLERLQDIEEAIKRYQDSDIPIPYEWVGERDVLLKSIPERYLKMNKDVSNI